MYILYKTTNKINGKIYVGIHKTETLEFDGYLGSGKILKQAIKRYGRENFQREILAVLDSMEDAQEIESKYVNIDFISDPLTYNICEGGGIPPNIDKWPEESRVKFIKRFTEYSRHRAKFDNPSKKAAGKNHWSRNTQVVKDEDGKTFRVANDDPNLHNGTFTPINKGKVTVKDVEGNTLSVDIADPRYISGELVSVNKGIDRKMTDAGRLKKTRTCPHCEKIGMAGPMNRWHFDNCKYKK